MALPCLIPGTTALLGRATTLGAEGAFLLPQGASDSIDIGPGLSGAHQLELICDPGVNEAVSSHCGHGELVTGKETGI